MDHLEQPRRQVHFVPLKVADQVPPHAGWQRRDLLACLLDAVLTDVPEAQVDRLADLRGRHRLADADQRHRGRVPAGTPGGGRDAAAHRLQIARQIP